LRDAEVAVARRSGSRAISALEGVPTRVFVVLSGADGSGKTTAARLLASLVSLRGPACTHWLRGSHLLASLLARFLSRFGAFRGGCNPYYGICVPRRLRGVWLLVEFWSFVPHLLARSLLRRLCAFLVCDRGSLDFLVWLVSTLNFPSLLRGVCGGFLLRLARGEGPVYLYADLGTLAGRADVPRSFLIRELAAYNALARYVAQCSIDTGVNGPLDVVRGVLECLSRSR
jgi:energy-coupling factor transporter ATP-binding protein EcfA2